MVTRYRSETGKYVYFANPLWTSLLGSNDTTFDKNGGIVFDEFIEKANTIIYAKENMQRKYAKEKKVHLFVRFEMVILL